MAKRRNDFDLTDPWPCDEDLTTPKKSSGLLIFASTLARFIKLEHHESNERLQLIITPPDGTVHEGRASVDPLYTHIFLYAFPNVKEDTVFVNPRRVLGTVIRRSIRYPKDKLRRYYTSNHPSLQQCYDILQDPDRCSNPKSPISSPVYHVDMVLERLGIPKKLRRNPCDLPDFVMKRDVPDVPDPLEDKIGGGSWYAYAYWAVHIRSSPIDHDHATRLVASSIEFLKENAHSWIEVISLERRVEDVIHNINNLDWLGTVRELSCE